MAFSQLCPMFFIGSSSVSCPRTGAGVRGLSRAQPIPISRILSILNSIRRKYIRVY
jgi:hypothetical protein